MDIVVWLRSLGLGKYEAAFRDNEIDETVLPSLTEEHLKQLGVTALGHRVKLLDAIAALRSGTSASGPSSDPKTPKGAPSASSEDRAERRQVTVMFSDLVGSTALSARMDPEDLREVISAYQKCVAETVGRFGGFVAKYMGDGVLIYFGYPQAHEDDAERAVRAGLELITGVGALKTHAALQTRIGIATGLVVVGDLIGSGASQEQAIIGETPNLAARLQGIAEPNSVVIAESTRKLVVNLFELEDLGPQELKGISAAVRAWAAMRAASVESRFDALHIGGLTELVGREEELELLLRRWSKAKAGEGQVVLLSGEPGIGKSRLTVALQEHLKGEPHARVRYFCSPQHTDSAFYPIIAQLERAAAFERHDLPESKLEKIVFLLGSLAEQRTDVQLLAELLSISIGNRYSGLDWSPQRKKEKTFEALLRQLDLRSRKQPVLSMYEDVHWIDPSSRELLDMTVDRVARLPVLLLITFRPEFVPPWTGQAHLTTLTLNRLARREGAMLVERLAGNRALPDEITAEIVERTDGVPLFVEELTKAILESAIDGQDASETISRAALPSLAVPTTLHASLMARLDRLGTAAKEVAQIGAAIGREFPYELLILVAQKNEEEVKASLARLSDAGLVFCRGAPPEANFLFKHALVRDAAYGSLLRSKRLELHARIANTIEAEFPDQAAAQPEVLGHHAEEAGLSAKAIGFWQKAGEVAVRRAANPEAIKHFRRALSLLGEQPDTIERSRNELAILSRLGPALMSSHGWASPEVRVAFERAAVVAKGIGNSVELAPPLLGLWLYHTSLGQLARADDIGVELFEIARENDSSDVRLQAHHAAFPIPWLRGELPEANRHIEALLALYDEAKHDQHRYIYLGHDPAVCALSIGAIVQTLLGYPDRAARLEDRVLALARRLRHPPSLAHALWFVGEAQLTRRDRAALAATAGELAALCEDQTLPSPRAAAAMFNGWLMAHSGKISEGIRLVEQGLSAWQRIGIRHFLPRNHGLLAQTYLAGERYTEGLAQVSLALKAAEQTGVRYNDALMYHLRALLLVHVEGMNSNNVEADLKTAIQIAQAQTAKGLELSAAVSLARLWRDQGKVQQARELLAPVYGWFTEGFDTRDLKEAKALLEELA
jgi:class 3 adenylate cyclase/predicted ATPase/DNA polymerase III delta prime subunit